MYFLKVFRKNNIVLFHQKGFSMIELMLSVGALSLFAILVQSMLVLGHSFTRSQQNLFDFLQVTRLIKQQLCVNNASFKNINLDLDHSYRRNVTVKTIGGKQVHSREYEKLTGGGTSTPIAGLRIVGIGAEPSFQNTAVNAILSTTSDPYYNYVDRNADDYDSDSDGDGIQDSGTGDGVGDVEPGVDVDDPLYYQIFQDSHTIVKMNFDSTTINTPGGFISGYIFVSRCVENSSDSVHTGGQFTFNPSALRKSSLYILSKLQYKPYYFPSTANSGYEVQCCTDGENQSTCKSANEDWVPRIYVIHLQPISSGVQSEYGFSGEVSYIQELPEMQDLNSIWGVGFVLSVDEKVVLSQSAFQLDTMFLKNSCVTSVTDVQRCRDISLGTDLSTQSLLGVGSSVKNMVDYIISDVSSCAGYSSGVDTTSLISL